MDVLLELRKIAINKSGRWIRDWILEKNYPGLASQLKEVTQFCPEDVTLKFRFQLLDRGLITLPKCKTCGKNLVTFETLYCNKKCSNSAPHRIEQQRNSSVNLHTNEARKKAASTCRKKYGSDTPFQSATIQDKATQTLVEKFGGTSAMMDSTVLTKSRNTWNLKSKEELVEIQRKREVSTYSSSNCLWAFHSKESLAKSLRNSWTKEARDKRYQTNLRLWGVSHPAKSLVIRKKFEIKRYSKEILDKLESREFWLEEYFKKKLPLYQIAKNLEVNDTNIAKYFYQFGFEVRESSVSNEEVDFRSHLLSDLQGERVILNPKFFEIFENSNLRRQELDLYLPDRKLAFEYNGIWYHDEYHGRDRLYHLKKTLECERLGIRLIHIWSDDWMFKRDCMISKIRSILGKSIEKIYARKCYIGIVDKVLKAKFYEKNHIKGNGGSSIDLGLFYQSQLVACISFKDMKNGVYDLNRYATSITVVGGFSRLLQYFTRNWNWSKIYTFADRSWSRGEVYLKSGFILVGETEPEFYGVGIKRINRLHYTKDLLRKNLRDYDEKKSQLGNLRSSGIPILWGCGQLKFELKR